MKPFVLPRFPWRRQHGAFTLIELLVVIGIVATLAAIILPVYGQTQQRSQSVKCLSNLRQIGHASLAYAGDHEMTLPASEHSRNSWSTTLQPYANGTITFVCPRDENVRQYTYMINDYLIPVRVTDSPVTYPPVRLSWLANPSQTFLFAEASKNYGNADHFHFADYHGLTIPPEVFADEVGVQRHGGSANYLFADAHVQNLSWEQAQVLLRTPGSRFVDPGASEPQ